MGFPAFVRALPNSTEPVLRASAKNKYTIWLVLWSVYCVASTSTYPQICIGGCALPDLIRNWRTKIRRNLAHLFFSETLRSGYARTEGKNCRLY